MVAFYSVSMYEAFTMAKSTLVAGNTVVNKTANASTFVELTF